MWQHVVQANVYLRQGGVSFMTVCLSAVLHKYYWLELHENNSMMGLGPTKN